MWLAVLAVTMNACSNPTIVPTAPPRPQLVVRMQPDPGALDTALMTRVAAEATAIWKRYVDIEFTVGDRDSARGSDTALTLIIRREPLRRPEADSIGLGAIEFPAPHSPAHAIAVSVAAAEMLSARGTWAGQSLDVLPRSVHDTFVARVLGRSVAHEIGHFLLRSTAHTHQGLMRPQFTVAELMDERLTRYLLEPAQVVALEGLTGARVPASSLIALLGGAARPDDEEAPADRDLRSSLAICASSTSARPCNAC